MTGGAAQSQANSLLLTLMCDRKIVFLAYGFQ
jgi:hypothetical protein